ncbi:hypothetical protein ACS0TY_005196 [Phlomoides rotata]
MDFNLKGKLMFTENGFEESLANVYRKWVKLMFTENESTAHRRVVRHFDCLRHSGVDRRTRAPPTAVSSAASIASTTDTSTVARERCPLRRFAHCCFGRPRV